MRRARQQRGVPPCWCRFVGHSRHLSCWRARQGLVSDLLDLVFAMFVSDLKCSGRAIDRRGEGDPGGVQNHKCHEGGRSPTDRRKNPYRAEVCKVSSWYRRGQPNAGWTVAFRGVHTGADLGQALLARPQLTSKVFPALRTFRSAIIASICWPVHHRFATCGTRLRDCRSVIALQAATLGARVVSRCLRRYGSG